MVFEGRNYMKDLTQTEFEQYIEDLIYGKYSKTELVKILSTDSRTLNNKIQELAATNPELYLRYIRKYPYKQKERDDIDFEALVIEAIQTGAYSQDLAKKYDIGVRTIQRRVAQIEKENPDLIELYRMVKEDNKNRTAASTLPPKIKERIASLIQRPVRISLINDSRRNYLLSIEKTFYERREQYGTVTEAAKSMGTTSNRIYKLLNELYRINIERESLEKSNTEEKSDFRKRIEYRPSDSLGGERTEENRENSIGEETKTR